MDVCIQNIMQPLDNNAHLYHRRFFNVDGSVAYEEIIDDDRVMI